MVSHQSICFADSPAYIDVGWHVADNTWIGVYQPRASNVVSGFIYRVGYIYLELGILMLKLVCQGKA
jgi:hypothetical protein